MAKAIEHVHWPNAPDMWMPYAPAIKVKGGTTVYLDVVTADRFVTDLSDQDALNRVWGEYFRDAKPATTTVQVVRLATDPRCLVEINAVAVVD